MASISSDDVLVGVGQIFVVKGAEQQVHALLQLCGAHFSVLDAGLVELADLHQAAIQRATLGVQQGHGDTDVGKAHGNAGTQGAGADDRDLIQLARGNVRPDIWNAPGLALSEEHMA